MAEAEAATAECGFGIGVGAGADNALLAVDGPVYGTKRVSSNSTASSQSDNGSGTTAMSEPDAEWSHACENVDTSSGSGSVDTCSGSSSVDTSSRNGEEEAGVQGDYKVKIFDSPSPVAAGTPTSSRSNSVHSCCEFGHGSFGLAQDGFFGPDHRRSKTVHSWEDQPRTSPKKAKRRSDQSNNSDGSSNFDSIEHMLEGRFREYTQGCGRPHAGSACSSDKSSDCMDFRKR
jgi:hypothetical protein